MDWELRSLVNELNQGKETAEELRENLNCISSSPQILVEKLLDSFEKAISMLNWNGFVPVEDTKQDQNQHSGSKKRKMEERWSEKVKVRRGHGLEGPVHHDGFSWRKYGQKDILGSNFPRGYYRCSYRPTQGCLAIKQVQRSDQDTSIIEVTYRGRHTCVTENTKKQKKQCAEYKTKPAKDVSSGFSVWDNDGFQRFPSFSFVREDIQLSPATCEWNCNNYLSTTSFLNEGNFGVQTPE